MELALFKNGTKIAQGENGQVEITGLAPNTTVPAGEYEVAWVNGDFVSEATPVPSFKTLPIAVTGVSVSPKTGTAVAGTAGSRNLTTTVEPSNATNKAVTYSIAPATTGLSVSSTGVIAWTEEVPAGTYTTTVKTTDGNKMTTHVLTLTEPEVEPSSIEMQKKKN